MNEIIKAMETRRSIRGYKEDMVPEELIAEVVEAGTYAATGMGRQSPIILAVTNKEVRDRLSKVNADYGNNRRSVLWSTGGTGGVSR